jgi:cation transport ATPase
MSRATTAIRGLYVMAALSAFAALLSLGEARLILGAINGNFISEEHAASVDGRRALFNAVWFLSYVVVAVIFIRWLRAAYDLCADENPEAMRYSKPWTVWAWMVPIAFLYIPYRIVSDVWKASGRETPDVEVAPIVTGWWALFLGMNALAYASVRLVASSSLDVVLMGSLAELLSDVCSIGAALLAARIVSEIHARLHGVPVARANMDESEHRSAVASI